MNEKNLSSQKLQDELIKNMILSQPESSSQIISTNLKSMEISDSCSTVRRRLSSLGVLYGRPISKSFLIKTKTHFSHRNMNSDWNKVIFTDQSTFQLLDNPEKNWVKSHILESKKELLWKIIHKLVDLENIYTWMQKRFIKYFLLYENDLN